MQPERFRVYLASSWRNAQQPAMLAYLRDLGHEVYDFRNPAPGDKGFSWEVTHSRPVKDWSPFDYREALDTPRAREGFGFDYEALRRCQVCVLLLPCGRSAHLELGFAMGQGKRCIVYCPKVDEPELMYLLGAPSMPAAWTVAATHQELGDLLRRYSVKLED